VTRSSLRLLQRRLCSKWRDDRRDFIRLMSNYDANISRADPFARAHHMLNKRASSSAVQNFCQI
jgi:hypothetical protein